MPKSSKKVKVRMRAKELVDADVAYISLVNRPASRAAFKVLKAEDRKRNPLEEMMINLSTLLRKRDDQEVEPVVQSAVVALAVRKEATEVLEPALKERGFSVEHKMEQEDVVIYKQVEGDLPEQMTGIQMGEHVVALVSGHMENTRKAFQPFGESTSFNENVTASGFMPGVFMAAEALMDTMGVVLRGSDSAESARAGVNKAVKDFGSFVMSMVTDLPEVAFKAEDLGRFAVEKADMMNVTQTGCPNGKIWVDGKCVDSDNGDIAPGNRANGSDSRRFKAGESDKTDGSNCPEGMMWDAKQGKCVMKDAKKKDAGCECQGEQAAEADTTDTATPASDEPALTEAMKGDIDPEVLNPAAASAEPVSTDTDAGETAKKSEDGPPAWFSAFATEVTEGLNGVRSDLDILRKDQGSLEGRLKAAETTAQKAESAARGTVLGGSDGGPEGQGRVQEQVNKDEDIWGGSALDRLLP